MLQNAYLLAKIGADTAENEQHFAEILPTTGNSRRMLNVRRGRQASGASAGEPAAGRRPYRSVAREVWSNSEFRTDFCLIV